MGYTSGMTFELLELDPTTGEEEELIMTGSMARCQARRDSILEEREEAWDDLDAGWPVLMIQPKG